MPQLGFFPLVALLERLAGSDAARVGGDDLASEAIRFKHDPALTFSAGDVAAVRELEGIAGGPRRFEVTTTFLGIAGGVSPTPSYVSEDLLGEEGHAQRDFLDIFHHRLLSLLYREIARFKPWAEQTAPLDDRWSARLFSLGGFAADAGPLRLGMPPHLLLRLLPLLSSRVRSSEGLSAALAVTLADLTSGAAVEIQEFTGGWSPAAPEVLTLLGQARCRLGQDVLLGTQVKSPAGAFDIYFGPSGAVDLVAALGPGGAALDRIEALVRLWTRDPIQYRVIVRLEAAQIVPSRLGESPGATLAVDAWLGRREHATALTVYPQMGLNASPV